MAALTTAATCLAILAPAQAQGRLLLYRIGRLGFAEAPTDIAVAGGYAYLAAGGDLAVVDVTNPTALRRVAVLRTPGETKALALDGATAFLADGAGGLRLVDVADAAAPVETGQLALDGPAHGVAAADGIALVALPRAVVVVDYADRAAPREVARLPFASYVADVALSGKLAFVASSVETAWWHEGGTDLHVFDLSDSGRPRAIGGVELTGASVAVVADGRRAYVAQYLDGNLLVPTPGPPVTCEPGPCTPTPVWTLPPPEGRLAVVDTNDGGPLVAVAEVRADAIEAIAVQGARAFVAGPGSGASLQVFDLIPGRAPAERWTTYADAFDGPGANAIAVTDDLVYLASPNDGLLILAAVPKGEPSPTPRPAVTRTPTRTPTPTVREVMYVPVAGR